MQGKKIFKTTQWHGKTHATIKTRNTLFIKN